MQIFSLLFSSLPLCRTGCMNMAGNFSVQIGGSAEARPRSQPTALLEARPRTASRVRRRGEHSLFRATSKSRAGTIGRVSGLSGAGLRCVRVCCAAWLESLAFRSSPPSRRAAAARHSSLTSSRSWLCLKSAAELRSSLCSRRAQWRTTGRLGCF